MRGVEVVFHLGALGSVPRSVQDPLTSSAVNVDGTLNVLLAARDEGIRRVVFSSSSSVYGSRDDLPADGGDAGRPDLALRGREARRRAPLRQLQPRLRPFESVVLRYFNVFGPRQSPHSQYAAVIPLFITAIAAGRADHVFGDGEQSRDFTYVDNVVDATMLAADAPDANGRILNVAAGSPRR